MADDNSRLLESGEDVANLSELFFVVNDDMSESDRYLVVRRDASYAAHVVACFKDFDYAHFCARRLTEYTGKHRTPEDE